ncbi:universal stress protein [Amycolatopsis sacchari]|uniref:Nucleotide-binding universal stress protein, UspA family n=1 Tax=Amycolatopsis sacchari TaxID=115433 RepID=A0A1I3KWD6_9PSEU|nr:universal stress protein [Amycolatopsis sacchari]SFI76829.1 Nucleotide-binding universal stress protein, UspA family [Amycolatopsis sacchari]
MSEHKIVVGVDGSPMSAAALRWAVRQAELTGGAVHAVTAWSYLPVLDLGAVQSTAQEMAEAHRRAQAKFVDAVRVPGVPTRAEVVEGDPADVLLAAARDADLLVVGRHGHGRLVRALVGSVSAKCLRDATCPVVVLPAKAAEAEREVMGSLGYEAGPIV